MPIRVFDHYVHWPVIALAVAEFVIAFIAALLAPEIVNTAAGLRGMARYEVSSLGAATIALAVVVGLASMGLYRVGLRASASGVLARSLAGVSLAVVGLTVLYYLVSALYVAPLLLIVSTVLLLIGIGPLRLAFHRVVDEDLFKRRIVVFGAGERAQAFTKLRRRADQRAFALMHYIATPSDRDSEIDPERVIEMPDDLCQFAMKNGIHEIVVALDDRRKAFPVRELLECRLQGIDVTEILNFMERETGKVDLELMQPSHLIFSSGFRRQLSRRVIQRLFDIVCSLVILVVASPIMLATAIAIVVEDGLPIFYRQRRVGQGNVAFDVLKFRSMRRDAEAGGKAVWASADDDRITGVGRIIRKLRVDELPQLINVLAGQMSLVGPRPERPEFVETLSQNIPYYLERHRVKPGITGWAQLCYPYGSSEKDAFEKLQYDLFYVKNRTLVFDLMILLQTVEVVVWQKGAR